MAAVVWEQVLVVVLELISATPHYTRKQCSPYYFYYYIYITTVYNIMISSNLIGRLMLSQQDKEMCQT